MSDISVTLDSDRFAWQQVSQRSLLFQSAVSQGTRVLVQSVTLDIRLLNSTMFSKYAEFASGTSVYLPSTLFIEHGRFIS